MAPGDSELEMVHARVIRQPDGRFALEDNQTRQGTEVNNVPVNGRILLDDGAVIRLGTNWNRFSEKHRRAQVPSSVPAPAPPVRPIGEPPIRPPVPAAAPPPPPARPPVPAAAPSPAPKPPGPVTAPAPKAAPLPAGRKPLSAAPAPATAPDGTPRCRSCGQPVPKGQTFCIVCNM